MAFATLTLDLIARIANIETDLGKVAHVAEQNAQRINKAFAAVGLTLGGLGAGLGAAGLISSLKAIADEADNLNDLGTRTQTSVLAIASLKLISEQSGTSIEALGAGLNKLTKYMGENADEARQLGLTAQDPVEAFLQLADVLDKAATPQDKAVIASKALGKSYADLLPLLNEGSEAIRRSVQASAAYAEGMAKLAPEADKFNDLIAQLNLNIGAFKNSVAADLLPILNAALEEINSTGKVSEATAKALSQMGTVGQTLAVLWANVEFVFKGVGREIGGIAAQLAAVAHGDFAGAAFIGEAMRKDAEKARSAFDEYERGLLGLAEGLKSIGSGQENFKRSVKGGGLVTSDILSEADANRLQSALRKAFDTKPLDDFIEGFQDKARKISETYTKLRIDLEPNAGGQATGLDVSTSLERARTAFGAGDVTSAGALLDKAKSQLREAAGNGAPGFETAFLSKQLEAFELSMNQAAEKAAVSTRDVLRKNLEAVAESIAEIKPIHLPIATEAIADDLRKQFDEIRKDLAANPLQIPTTVIADDAANLRRAALKFGAR